MGVNGGVDFTEGVYEGKETCQRSLYVCYMHEFANKRENNKHCLEMSVNNL
jgi:hypothetical protein